MLYETLSQPKLLLVFIIFGFLSGFVFDISNFIKVLSKNNKIVNIILDFVSTVINLGLLFLVNLTYNYGEFRAFAIAVYEFGFTIQRFTLGKLLAKLFLWCYNAFVEGISKLKNIFKRKNEKQKS